jgi:hypothetical protein
MNPSGMNSEILVALDILVRSNIRWGRTLKNKYADGNYSHATADRNVRAPDIWLFSRHFQIVFGAFQVQILDDQLAHRLWHELAV